MPARRGRAVDVGHGIAATGSAGLVKPGGVFTEPVGADKGISSARPGVFWGSVPVRGWDVARGLGGGGDGSGYHGDAELNEGSEEKVLFHKGFPCRWVCVPYSCSSQAAFVQGPSRPYLTS